MVDREKVIKALECCAYKQNCIECPYYKGNSTCMDDKDKDALELLRRQEAKPMTEYDDGWDCPRCGLKLVGKTASGYPCDEFDLPNDEIVKYCPVCGQAVKWE